MKVLVNVCIVLGWETIFGEFYKFVINDSDIDVACELDDCFFFQLLVRRCLFVRSIFLEEIVNDLL